MTRCNRCGKPYKHVGSLIAHWKRAHPESLRVVVRRVI